MLESLVLMAEAISPYLLLLFLGVGIFLLFTRLVVKFSAPAARAAA